VSIRLKSFRSAIIVTGSGLVQKFLNIASIIVLARLLAPSDFGLIALANILIGALNTFSNLGLRQALIATYDDKIKASFHTFVATLAMGIVLSVGMFSLADVYASLYDHSSLAAVCRWMAPIVLIGALVIVPDALLVREMMFGRRVLPSIVATLSGITVSVSMAYAGYGVWSLVFGALTVPLIRLIGIALVCPEWQWLRLHKWNAGIMGRLIKFGIPNMSTGVVRYFYNNLDFFTIGKALGTHQLGFYTQGFNLSNLVVTNVSSMVNSVLLPSYRKIGEDKERLASAYLNSFQMVTVITIPFAMGIFVIAPDVVIVLLGEKWRDAIPILEIFAFMSLIRPLSGTTSPVFLSLGFPEYNLRTALIQAGALAVLVLPFVRWGIAGVASAVVITFAIGFVHNIYLVCYKTGLSIQPYDIIRQTFPSLAAGIIMVIIIAGLKLFVTHMFSREPGIMSLLTLILAGACTYVISLYYIERKLVDEIINLAKSSVGLQNVG